MTEDDTFNKLCKEDFYSVYSRWVQHHSEGNPTNAEFLIGTGWTIEDFCDAFTQWLTNHANQTE